MLLLDMYLNTVHFGARSFVHKSLSSHKIMVHVHVSLHSVNEGVIMYLLFQEILLWHVPTWQPLPWKLRGIQQCLC